MFQLTLNTNHDILELSHHRRSSHHASRSRRHVHRLPVHLHHVVLRLGGLRLFEGHRWRVVPAGSHWSSRFRRRHVGRHCWRLKLGGNLNFEDLSRPSSDKISLKKGDKPKRQFFQILFRIPYRLMIPRRCLVERRRGRHRRQIRISILLMIVGRRGRSLGLSRVVGSRRVAIRGVVGRLENGGEYWFRNLNFKKLIKSREKIVKIFS